MTLMNSPRSPHRLVRKTAVAGCVVALLNCSSLWADAKKYIVSADGSGDFRTVQQAIDAVPEHSNERTVIHLKPGTYSGPIVLRREKPNVTFAGDDAATTVLTYALNVREPDREAPTSHFIGTGVVVLADNFRAENITFQNTSGDHGQALALRIDGDRAILHNCRLLGWQDTLLLSRGRQYLCRCYVEGRVDFIYGAATAVFDRCEIHSKNGGHVTAASTPQDHPFGFVFFDCRLTGDSTPWKNPSAENATTSDKAISNGGATATKKTPQADLGRPWRPFGSVMYINCWMGDHIKPQGWDNWRNADNEKTARYAEYHSTGPGANPAQRVSWSKQLSDSQAAEVTVEKVLSGDDAWDPAREFSGQK